LILRLALLAVGAAGTALSASASAQDVPYRWQNVTVGAGGFAPAIIYSPVEEGLAYLRTDMGGAYRWDDRAQRWIPLQDGMRVGSYLGIESIAPDPKDANTVYVAAGMYYGGESAIMRSHDKGTTWKITPVPFKMGGNEDGRGLGERLAVDPNKTSILYFGSRHDGLQRSDDSGASWRKVASFPHNGLGAPPHWRVKHAGISFVLFDPRSPTGAGSSVIYAGVADPAEHHLYRSRDGGKSWAPVPGEPPAAMLPAKAALDGEGNLYITYSTSVGPNDVKGGSVWRLDSATDRWTEITPNEPAGSQNGYMGISVDRTRPGRLAVATMNRWFPGDTVWVSNDYGKRWTSLSERSHRDTGISPFLNWGKKEAEFGHWIAGLAFDPFDGNTLSYTTGATVYRTQDANRSKLLWTPWVKGIEQTAVITMISPSAGAPLISGFGDIAGFVHDRLDVSPPQMHINPRLTNTNNLDYAGLAPNIVVRSGSGHGPQDATLAWSSDGGRNWQPLKVPPMGVAGGGPPQRFDRNGESPINVSADGSIFIVGTPAVVTSRDRGKSWQVADGLDGARAIADKVDPNLFYAVDFEANQILVSKDGARTFVPVPASGLPAKYERNGRTGREAQWPLVATPGTRGELWFLTSRRLFRGSDAGNSFKPVSPEGMTIDLFGLGKAAPGSTAPALYAAGEKKGVPGIYRSIDGGKSWSRINDDQHQWGLHFRAVIGDPKTFGRVYVATDGRGIIYGDPAR
jgi:xyloglucan-specific exo-beta-1,4-glucanase